MDSQGVDEGHQELKRLIWESRRWKKVKKVEKLIPTVEEASSPDTNVESPYSSLDVRMSACWTFALVV